MTATDWLVITGGIAAIIWVNWYFFFAQRATAEAGGAAGAGGVQQQ